MKNLTIKKNIKVVGGVLASLFVLGGIFSLSTNVVLASFQPACPFNAQAGRTIVHFEDQVLSGGVRSDAGSGRAYKTVSASLPAGTYNISLQSFDGGSGSDRGDQPHEQYFLQLKNGGTVVAQTNSTTDLPDHVATPVWYGQVNNSLVLSQSINTVTAVSSVYPDASNPNSVNVGCAAFDLVSTPCTSCNVPALVASCSANPDSANVGNPISWSATASGGTGSYTYSWTGTDGLSGNSSYISKSYSSPGSKLGTVTITSGSRTAVRNCSVNITAPQDQTLVASCSVNPSSTNIGGSLNWSVTASGGTGSYVYSWSGTDSLYGNSSYISKSYYTAGTKTGTVTVNSGNQTVSRTCSGVIVQDVSDDLVITCSVSDSRVDVDEDVTWRSYPTGGNGSYTYDWEGTDDLSGNSRNLTWSYDDDGTKRGTVTITSGSQTASASCTVRVNEDEDDDLSVSCYASPTNTQVGNRVNWYVDVDGGDGDYDYDWSGTDGLNSSSRSPYMTYNTPGSKRATITVTDGDGNEETATCYTNVNSVLAYTQTYQPPVASAVYLSQVPYTGFADNVKLYSFVGMLAFFSAWIAYIIIERKREVGELN